MKSIAAQVNTAGNGEAGKLSLKVSLKENAVKQIALILVLALASQFGFAYGDDRATDETNPAAPGKPQDPHHAKLEKERIEACILALQIKKGSVTSEDSELRNCTGKDAIFANYLISDLGKLSRKDKEKRVQEVASRLSVAG